MEQKIRNRFNINVLIPALASYIVLILSGVIWGVNFGVAALGAFILLLSLMTFYVYIRTRHSGSLVSAIYLAVFASFLFSISPYIKIGHKLHLTQPASVFFALTLLMLVWLLYLNFTKKLKWRGREILELAAQNVGEVTSSHTDRPLPTGNVEYKQDELSAFARFFEKNLLGLTYKEANRIVFMPLKYKNEYFALYNPRYNYKEKTWVAISNTGNMSVNISKEDYLDYKEDLAFDQLCRSLSETLTEFIDLHVSGKEVRIIDKLNDMKISIFS